ncbi:MAG: glycerophosphoryl diester phosphodiesterase membrane domain-containing protein [Opitutaceae bacterium]|nr:glycerophosphoryl diester phosphodiesterase membrane domain-containing protein [Opitutaceae bacterium]
MVVVIWLPLDLLSSYMDFFVFDPEDFRRSFRFSQFLDNFVGIIATAGVISIGYSASLGSQPSFGSALSVGASSWGRMWWTRFLTGLAIIFGLLLLIIPGVYLFVRLALVEPVAVCERVSGPDALRRSFELTEGRFWQVFCLGLVLGGVMIAAVVCVVLPSILIPAADHWLIDAATSLLADLVGAYGTLCVLCAYLSFSEVQGLAELGRETPLAGGLAMPTEMPPVLS